MLRPSSLSHALTRAAGPVVAMVTALAALTGIGALEAATPASAAVVRPLDPEQPLVPRIRSMTPDYVPDKGPIMIRGTLTNVSDQTWTAINVHGFMGATPITSAQQLSDATKTPVEADVGDRITVPGTFDSIHALAPGETTRFAIRLPQRTLPVSTPGVYWFGVHVLGDNGEGDPRVAVGRDRTFIPYVPDGSVPAGGHEDTALVLQLRAGVARGPDGAVLDPEGWARSLRSGPLATLVRTAQAARDRPLTWLVDPAVLDVVRRLAQGNPPRTLTSPATPGNENPSESPSPSGSPSASGSSASESAAGDTTAPSTATVAHRWLREVRPLLSSRTSELLGLPYGDLAVDSAARNDSVLLPQAFRRTGHALRPWGVPLNRVVAPPDGRIDSESLPRIPHDTNVLLPEDGVDGAGSVVNRVGTHEVLLTSSAALEGGPGPAPPLSSLALRQRVLAEAALRVLDDQQPLLVELPTQMHRPLRSSFFTGLEVPWLRLTTVDGATGVPPTRLDPEALRAPSPDQPQLGSRVYDVAENLLESGATLQSVLTENHVLRRQLFQEATGNASYAASVTPFLALARMHQADSWVRDNIDAIGLSAPQSVTLASNSGRFSAIVSNELDVPVTVKVRATADRGVAITGGEQVQLAPHGRTPVLLHASTHIRGVLNVKLELTNARGRPLGVSDTFPMRAGGVSRLIWVIIGVGVALLFTTIAIRLTRRIIAARAGRTAP